MSPTPQLDAATVRFIRDAVGVKDVTIDPIAGDASNRRYFRAIYGEDSCVVMAWEPFKDNDDYPFLSVHSHFAKHKVNVPRVIAKSPELGVILLEDLGDLTLERKFWENQNQDVVLPFYKQAVDELIKIHFSANNDTNKSCTAFKVSFNTEKLLWEMNYGREHLLQKLCGLDIDGAAARELDQVFSSICSTLDREPKHICHRDYHSRNIMLKLGKARIIDFQDARLGTVQYDLVSLVHDSYVDLNEASRDEIISYYLEAAAAHGFKESSDHFDEIFRIQVIQRCFKACGSFASFYNMREDQRYLRYISPTLHKVTDALRAYPDYSVFSKIIQDNGLLEKDYTKPLDGL